MSSYEQKDGDIVIFKNKKKTPEDKLPTHTGTCTINGEKLKVALWVRTSANGTQFMSGKIQPDNYKPSAPAKVETKTNDAANDDDLAF